ncbi:MAG: hypothetical protein AB1779_05395, partial [Candidatus Thermoplasmatota archaeon]
MDPMLLLLIVVGIVAVIVVITGAIIGAIGFSSFKRDTERLASTRARKVTIEEEEYVDPDLIAAEEERKR